MSFIDHRRGFLSLLTVLGVPWALIGAPVLAEQPAEAKPTEEVWVGPKIESLKAPKEAQHQLFANGFPQASSNVDSVVDEGGGLFSIGGTALDRNGNPACALVLASGRCMFTCGAGSPRCEGGVANLPFGRFELNDLPTETNGTIVVQTFIQGHVSGTQVLGGGGGSGTANWGVVQQLCCQEGPLTFSVSVDGVTRSSTTSSCNGNVTWEGYATATAGTKNMAWSLSGICASGNGTVEFNLLPDRCHFITSDLNEAGELILSNVLSNCGDPFSRTEKSSRQLKAID